MMVFLFFMMSLSVQAKVSKEAADKLEKELTPIGAEKAGNADGTIPEWTGGYKDIPEGFVEFENEPDPFKNDPILFTITPQNLGQYKGKLTPGQIAMFESYPDTYKMNIYQTRRTACYPQYVYDAVKRNAVNAETNETDYSLNNFEVFCPFPIPKTGLEVLWNYICGYLSPTGAYTIINGQAIMNRDGQFTLSRIEDAVLRPFNAEGTKPDKILSYFKQRTIAPPRLAGNLLLVYENIDIFRNPRQAFLYNSGQRRIRRAPSVAYDAPGTASDGLTTADDYAMYNGSPDKYSIKLIGKREIYIPYNCRQTIDRSLSYKDILTPYHINPDYIRYELHRVWVIEMDLKENERHIYKKRVYYFDEDSYSIVIGEKYDKRDQLWRVSQNHVYHLYQIPMMLSIGLITHCDLQSRRYLAFRLVNEEKELPSFRVKMTSDDFTPSTLSRWGIR
ncbi:MAG: DUF1329 domain-containing protein [Proteobacteria bacterium]|nr:DUF1329 domain-containing protein [Pseudomonadota bacterium]